MRRRKFLIGAGSLAVGTAGAIGTGAFTSVSAQRTVGVASVSDPNAYLALTPTDERAFTTNGQLKLEFNGSNHGASGLNQNARTAFTDLFEIKNQGDNTVVVAVGVSESDIFIDGPDNDGDVGSLTPTLLGDQSGFDNVFGGGAELFS